MTKKSFERRISERSQGYSSCLMLPDLRDISPDRKILPLNRSTDEYRRAWPIRIRRQGAFMIVTVTLFFSDEPRRGLDPLAFFPT